MRLLNVFSAFRARHSIAEIEGDHVRFTQEEIQLSTTSTDGNSTRYTSKKRTRYPEITRKKSNNQVLGVKKSKGHRDKGTEAGPTKDTKTTIRRKGEGLGPQATGTSPRKTSRNCCLLASIKKRT